MTIRPPEIKYHRWVVPVPVEIDVIQNEDRKMIGRMPHVVRLVGQDVTIDMSDIFCANCEKSLREVWGEVCEGD